MSTLMRTIGIKPGDPIALIDQFGDRQLIYNALVLSFSMDEAWAGTRGEPLIQACFVERHTAASGTFRVQSAVHISHRAFIERRSLGYEELPDAVRVGRL